MSKYAINFQEHQSLIPREVFGILDPTDPLCLGKSSVIESVRSLFLAKEFDQVKISYNKIFVARWFRAEIFVAEVYYQLCQHLTDQAIIKVFQEIIQEELKHANIAYNFYRYTFNEDLVVEFKPVEITNIEYSLFSMVCYETLATSLMHTYYDLTQSENIRRIFKEILADDVGHANNLLSLYKSYNTTPTVEGQYKLLLDECMDNPGDFAACYMLGDHLTDVIIPHSNLIDQCPQTISYRKFFKKDINRHFGISLIE